MSFLDKFRRQPEWKHPDPAIRAEAVRRLPASENHDLLVGFAQADADPVVRRAAVRKLADAAVVIALSRSDEDEGVREAAADRLLEIALGGVAASAEQAAAALEHPRHLAALAREATLAPVRLDAARRVTGDRALAALARAAEDPEVRRAALARLGDASALAEVALKTEHKDVALAALERVAERDALESIATRARSKAAAKRARALIEERWPAPVAVEPAPPAPDTGGDEAEAARYDELAARQTAEVEERASRLGARLALCEAVEALAGEEDASRVDDAAAAWSALPALEGVEADSLRRRFDAAADAWRARRADREASQARRGRMDALCAELEAAAEAADGAEAARRHAEARKAWTALQSAERAEPELAERYARAVARLEARAAESRGEQSKREEEARARLASLCGQAEELAGAAAPSLKDCERVLRDARAALEEPAGGKSREAVLGRLKTARAKLYARVLELRESEDWKRWANVGVQEDLCRQAEALLEEKDLPKAARMLRDLDARWKQASQAPKAQGEPLWQRFSAARAQVRARCAAHFSETRAARADNVKKKEALVTEAESLAESTDWGRTAERMRALQAEWRTVGPIARGRSDELWGRFRKAAGRFFDRQKEDRVRRRDERSKSLERREALAAQVEALAASSDWDRAAAEVKRLQSEWRGTGPVAKDKAEAVALRFQKASDAFFERYRKRDALEAEARLAEREALCARIEGLAAGGDDEAGVAERLREVQAAWAAAPALSGERGSALADRYAAAVDAVVAARPEAFLGTDLDPAANLARLASLCESVEALSAGAASPAAAAVSPATLLAERWREALAANTMGAKVDEGAARRQRKEKVEAARAAWSRVGPIAPAERERLAARFRDACRRALGEGS